MMRAERSNHRAMLSLAAILSVGAVGACGDGAEVAAVPTLRDYEGQFVYRLKPLLSPSKDTLVTTCKGRVSIAEPPLGDVNGTFLVQAAQGACIGAGEVVGSVAPDGGIIVELSAEGQPRDELFPAFGCRPLDGFTDFIGTITVNELVLDTDFVAACPIGGSEIRAQWLVSFRGER